MRKRRAWLLSYAPIIVWVGVILFLSGDQASMPSTSRFIRPLLRFFFPEATESTLQLYHGYIRKFAHFAEYAVLAFFAARAFRATGPPLSRIWPPLTILLAAFVALTDEGKQLYSMTRTGSLWDVVIDILGAIFATLILGIFWRVRKKRVG